VDLGGVSFMHARSVMSAIRFRSFATLRAAGLGGTGRGSFVFGGAASVAGTFSPLPLRLAAG